METIISSAYFKNDRDKGNYIVYLKGGQKLSFAPYSSLDGIAAAAIENAIQNKIDENRGITFRKKEYLPSSSTTHEIISTFPPKYNEHDDFTITTDLKVNNPHAHSDTFYKKTCLRNRNKSMGFDYGVLFGEFPHNKNKYFVKEAKKVFGKLDISADIITKASCSEVQVFDWEIPLIRQHFEDNIFQVLSTPAQELARKPV